MASQANYSLIYEFLFIFLQDLSNEIEQGCKLKVVVTLKLKRSSSKSEWRHLPVTMEHGHRALLCSLCVSFSPSVFSI